MKRCATGGSTPRNLLAVMLSMLPVASAASIHNMKEGVMREDSHVRPSITAKACMSPLRVLMLYLSSHGLLDPTNLTSQRRIKREGEVVEDEVSRSRLPPIILYGYLFSPVGLMCLYIAPIYQQWVDIVHTTTAVARFIQTGSRPRQRLAFDLCSAVAIGTPGSDSIQFRSFPWHYVSRPPNLRYAATPFASPILWFSSPPLNLF